jgi:hypothetical protein
VLDDPTEAAEIVDALAEAHLIDVGAVDHDLAPPDREVVFLSGEEVLARLGYHREIGSWGEHEVPGRWVDEDRLLDAVVELPDGG